MEKDQSEIEERIMRHIASNELSVHNIGRFLLTEGRDSLTDQEFQEVRKEFLKELIKPPRVDRSVALTCLIAFAIGLAVFGFGISLLDRDVRGALGKMFGGGMLGGTALFILWRNFRSKRQSGSYSARLDEAQELFQESLITKDEFEEIKRALISSSNAKP